MSKCINRCTYADRIYKGSILEFRYIYIYVVLRGWIKSAARYYISDIYTLRRYYINFLQKLPVRIYSCIATNEAIKSFCGGYYSVDDINYLCHVRCGMFPRDLLRKHT